MKSSLANITVIVSLLSLVGCASIEPSVKSITSPVTGKEYLFINTHSSTTHPSAHQICASHDSELASLSPRDIDFLGGYVESLDEPYWLGGLSLHGIRMLPPCLALYSGGAVAIPKSTTMGSECDSQLNVLCEKN